jgi:hypothetical protein
MTTEECTHDEVIEKLSGALLCTDCRTVIGYANEPRYYLTMTKEEQ